MRIAGLYALLSGGWIALSDRLVARLSDDPAVLTILQTAKGWAFVLATAVLMGVLIRRALHRELTAAEALRESRTLYQATVEQAAVGIAHLDLDGRWCMVNQRFCDIVGWPRDELLARKFSNITHPDDRTADCESIRRMLAGESNNALMEKRYLRPDGHPIWIMLSAQLVRHHLTNEPQFFIAVIQDINDRKMADQRLQAALEEKEVLLGEVHHRVRNNLQLVISLLALEATKVTDPGVHQAFDDALARIHAIGLIHQQLYERGDFARMDFADYVHKLCMALRSALAPASIRFVFELAPTQCKAEPAMPMAMVVVELVMNAIKHAFPDGRAGTVTIRLSAPGGLGGITLEVEDDGLGAPEPMHEGTGLTIARMLTHQLDGTLTREPSPRGTKMRLAVGCRTPCAPL
ncbi:MAG: PAS domain S-box protein [Rhodospirillaceae bacterium]|nr:PAS domain S-box protein [Rhodospirillales bacterium]